MKNIILRFVKLMVGLTIMAVGIAFAYESNLGLSPWDVLSDGVAKNLPLTFGQAGIALGFVILIFDIVLKERLGFGTFLNILTVGTIVDIVVAMEIIPSYRHLADLSSFAPRLALCLASLIPMAFGMYFYMSAALGAGPRDSLMCAITKRSPLPVGANRILIEGVALVCGMLLGGKVGIGTVILVLLSGPVMQILFKIFKFDVKVLKSQTIPETIAQIKKECGAKNTPSANAK